jgi:DNA repair photolyase
MQIKKIKRNYLLYKSGVEYEDYACNHVFHCTHNCQYPCYARLKMKVPQFEWANTIYLVENSIQLLQKEIPKYRDDIKQVHLSFLSDPFMYKVEPVQELTLEILDLLKLEDIKYKVLTKGVYPVDEIKQIERKNSRKNYEILLLPENKKMFDIGSKTNEYGISLVSLDENFRKRWEPGASPYKERLEALKELAKHGFYTYIYMEPLHPDNISIQEFERLLENVSFVKKIYFGSWQYNRNFKDKTKYVQYIELIRQFCEDKNIQLLIKKEVLYTNVNI